MQQSFDDHSESFDNQNSVIVTGNEGGMQESVTRLREERLRLHYTVTQVCKLVDAGNYGVSEATVRRFFDEKSTAEPQQNTIDVISAVLYGTSRDEFDPTQAHRYFRECAELKISIANLQQTLARTSEENSSLTARLKAYEEAVAFYRRQLETTADTNARLIKMIDKKGEMES